MQIVQFAADLKRLFCQVDQIRYPLCASTETDHMPWQDGLQRKHSCVVQANTMRSQGVELPKIFRPIRGKGRDTTTKMRTMHADVICDSCRAAATSLAILVSTGMK
jgi:hypothetical protein